jgi:hypothetical protein
MESVHKVVEYINLKGERQFKNVIMVLPIAYEDKNKPVNCISTGRRSNRGLWRNKIKDTNRLCIKLSAQLGIAKEEWSSIIMQT